MLILLIIIICEVYFKPRLDLVNGYLLIWFNYNNQRIYKIIYNFNR